MKKLVITLIAVFAVSSAYANEKKHKKAAHGKATPAQHEEKPATTETHGEGHAAEGQPATTEAK